MKIHNAISLLELQSFLHDHNISIGSVRHVASANAWRVILCGPERPTGVIGIGRDIGEALKNAFERYSTPEVK